MSRKIKTYSDEERLSILRDYYSSGMSKVTCVRKYGLCGHSLLNSWIRMYKSQFKLVSLPSELADTIMIDLDKEGSQEAHLSLKQRISELEQALAYSKLETLSRDVLIDKAEEYYNISIRKKSGVKQ